MKQTEKLIERAILSYLNILPNVFAWKCNTMGVFDRSINKYRTLKGFSIRGVSDILGVISPQGIMLAIECKTEKGLIEHYKYLNFNGTMTQTTSKRMIHSQLQHDFILNINKAGGVAGFATSIDDVKELLGDHI